jgi:formylglycine-generating enzyme
VDKQKKDNTKHIMEKSWYWRTLSALYFFITLSTAGIATADSVVIPGGIYRPFLAKKPTQTETIASFKLDTTPVTNAQFAAFLQNSPQWQVKNIPRLFAENNYLQHWTVTDSQEEPPEDLRDAPVTYVSWFAAKAYCRAQQGRLATTAEWEWAGTAGQVNFKMNQQEILAWYEKPTPKILPDIKLNTANAFGLFDMHGLIWEWTQDFNASMSSGESRGDSATDNQFFCGGAGARSADPSDYATFMRFAMRSSLAAHYTQANLGFRCAYDISPEHL